MGFVLFQLTHINLANISNIPAGSRGHYFTDPEQDLKINELHVKSHLVGTFENRSYIKCWKEGCIIDWNSEQSLNFGRMKIKFCMEIFIPIKNTWMNKNLLLAYQNIVGGVILEEQHELTLCIKDRKDILAFAKLVSVFLPLNIEFRKNLYKNLLKLDIPQELRSNLLKNYKKESYLPNHEFSWFVATLEANGLMDPYGITVTIANYDSYIFLLDSLSKQDLEIYGFVSKIDNSESYIIRVANNQEDLSFDTFFKKYPLLGQRQVEMFY